MVQNNHLHNPPSSNTPAKFIEKGATDECRYVYGLYICMLVYIYIIYIYICMHGHITASNRSEHPLLKILLFIKDKMICALHIFFTTITCIQKLRYPHHPNPKKLLRKLIKIGNSPSRIRLHEIHPLQLRLRNYSFEGFSRKLMKFKLCKFYPMLI